MLENPGYENTVKTLPGKIFSGKNAVSDKGVFFCYELPSKCPDGSWTSLGEGFYKWYFFNPETEEINEQAYDIWPLIKSEKDTPRVLTIAENDFSVMRKAVDAYINKTYMRAIQAPIGIKPRLTAWMQLG
jgi:hypothetical protein